MNPRSNPVNVTLVHGFVPWDVPPRICKRHGLTTKLGVVIRPLPGTGEEPFPVEAHLGVMRRLWNELRPQRAEVRADGERIPRVVATVEELVEIAQSDETGLYPPKRVVFFADRPVLLFEATWWSMVGGPAPYWDDDAIAIYSPSDVSSLVHDELVRLQALGVVGCVDRIEGSPHPPPAVLSVLRRFLARI